MKKYLILIVLVGGINSFGQEIKDSIKNFKKQSISLINPPKKDSVFHFNINYTKNRIPHNCKSSAKSGHVSPKI